MTIKLSQPDFQHLTSIVQNLPDFASVRDRRRLFAGALLVAYGVDHCVRISYATDINLLREGLEGLDKFIQMQD